MSERDPTDVTIIGAGIIGLAIGVELTRRGYAVTLCDPDEPGSGCSFGNAGHIATQAIEPLASPATVRGGLRHLFSAHAPLSIRPSYAARALPWLLRFVAAAARFDAGVAALRALQAHSLPAWQRLAATAGCAHLLDARGHLLVAESPAGCATLQAQLAHFGDHDIAAEWRSGDELHEQVPGLGEQVSGGLYFPGTAHVIEPFDLCRQLADWLAQHGATIRQQAVAAIERRGDGWCLHLDGATLDTSTVIVAAGAYSRTLAQQLGHSLPLDTERGYHVQAPEWLEAIPLPIASHERHTIMTPMHSGLRITGFVELGGLDLPPAPARWQDLRRHLESLLPAARDYSLKSWMGRRPSLPDHLPVIGTDSSSPRALLAFGHQHLGLTLAAVTAELVGDLLQGRQPAVELAPFRPDRFA